MSGASPRVTTPAVTRRRRLRRLVTSASVIASLLAGFMTLDSGTSEAAAGSGSTYSYGDHTRQTVTAHWTEQAGGRPQPGIMIVHGGYWYEDNDWTTWAQRFADAGYAVFDVDYRLNFDAAWPAQRTDALTALDWIKDNAARFDLDPDRIVVLGSSAGGQIATSLATYGAGGERVRGVVALSPVASPYRAWSDGNTSVEPKVRKVRDNAAVLARCHPDPADTDASAHSGCWDTWQDMVVRNHASGADDASMYLIHSEGDFVPAAHSLDLRAAEAGKGMPEGRVAVEVVPGAAHGGALLEVPGQAGEVLGWIAAQV